MDHARSRDSINLVCIDSNEMSIQAQPEQNLDIRLEDFTVLDQIRRKVKSFRKYTTYG